MDNRYEEMGEGRYCNIKENSGKKEKEEKQTLHKDIKEKRRDNKNWNDIRN